ncbi:MAG TPA: 16S rRNA (guanine(966)-N(2))-methyltransferase RsmD [Candidatus Acidoferrum sp.]|nr:16S rRNA (guanine(966)-N(2))-methyltransferase RsmD [Candidatus Acidoferrum sp.]
MRVIAGKFRSRRLKGPKSLRLRPTSDRLRETLFNIIGPAVDGSLFVDLFAGTGAIGIEALSRGAREVFFAESHAASANLIRENLTALDVREGALVMEHDALRALENLASRHLLADFIFLDPPYAESDEHLRILEFLDSSHLVAPYGLVIVEHHGKTALPERLDRLERVRLLEQGDASLSFYRLAAAA